MAETASISEQLKEIELAVADINIELEQINGQATELQSEHKSLNSKLAELKRKEKGINQELDQVSEQLATGRAALQQSKQEYNRLVASSADRLVAAYIHSRSNHNWLEESRAGQIEWHKISYYSSRTRRHDLGLLKSISQAADQLKLEQERLGQLVGSHDKVKAKLKAERAKIETVVKSQARVLAELNDKKAQSEKQLAQLEAQSLRLETVMVSLTEGGSTNFYGREQVPGKMAADTNLSFVGAGLKAFRGKLDFPAAGANTISPEDIDSGFRGRQGLHFKTGLDANISAIATGQVIFAGRMPGYENTVIMDHGQRSYTVYSKLGSITVQKGDIVGSGKVLGKTGVDGRIYLEIREAGKTVDPRPFFKS